MFKIVKSKMDGKETIIEIKGIETKEDMYLIKKIFDNYDLIESSKIEDENLKGIDKLIISIFEEKKLVNEELLFASIEKEDENYYIKFNEEIKNRLKTAKEKREMISQINKEIETNKLIR
jgi:hypothetical protein